MGVRKRKALSLAFFLLWALLLTGCRARTSGSAPGDLSAQKDRGAADTAVQGEESSLEAPWESPALGGEDDPQKNGEPGDRTQENPGAQRKEYDENAPAEVVPGTDRWLHGEGEGAGTPNISEEATDAVTRLDDQATDPATQTVTAQEAEELGASEDGEEADSALTYYTVLLQDRRNDLFECQKLNVYWETTQDHVTVHKTSPEHALILNAGAYDVSARLLPENLLVDDGWVARKNPNLIVKIVDSAVLGGGVYSTNSARAAYQALIAREGWAAIDAVKKGRILLLSQELLEGTHLQTAAMLLIAQCGNPDSWKDTDAGEALQRLYQEAAGALPTGVFYYAGKEETP